MGRNMNIQSSDWAIAGRVNWGAVVAGVILGLITQAVLSMLGLAIGLSALNPADQTNYSGFGVGSAIWLVLTSIISFFVGALAASWWANLPLRSERIFHGLLTGSLLMLVMFFLLSTGLGRIIGGAYSLAYAGVMGASQGLAQTADTPGATSTIGGNVQSIQQRLADVMPTTGPAAERLKNADVSNRVRQQMSERISAGDNQGAAAILSRETGMSSQEAQDVVENSQLETREVAQQVTDVASGVTWMALLITVLSLVAAALGGMFSPRRYA